MMKFMERTSVVLAAIHEEVSELRASNARTDRQVLSAVASVYIEPSTLTFLNRQKIYAIAMGDDVMEVINADAF